MSKTTIASAVLAGFSLAERLQELGVQDQKLSDLIGELASSLGAVMDSVEKVDTAVGIVGRAAQNDDLLTVVEGCAVIKGVTSDLVSDQDKIMQAMLSEEDLAIMQLLQILQAGGIR
jgi:hypothetical protein